MACIATCVEEREGTAPFSPPEDEVAPTPADRVDRVREAIERAGLTLYKVSALTAARRAGRGANGVVTHTLYRDVRAGHVPTLPQLVSLSRVTRRPLSWWLSTFGVGLSALASLQMAVHGDRTIPLPSRTFDPSMAVPHWDHWSAARDPRRIQRLADIVEDQREIAAYALDRATRRRFLYLSVGALDPWLAPEIAAGSVVRVDPRQSAVRRFSRRRAIHAVAHGAGLSCCYVEAVAPGYVAVFGDSTQAAPLVCKLGHDAAILGRVDGELRFPDRPATNMRPLPAFPRRADPIALPDARRDTFGRFVRRSRALIGLTFREARALTDRVAAHLADERFRISIGALSNYETLDALPGSIHALFSLAVVYAIDFWALLRAGGLRVGPDDVRSRVSPEAPLGLSPWMDDILSVSYEIPLFIAPVLREALGTSGLDPKSLFLWGSGQRVLDPRLQGAIVLAVDRDKRSLVGGGARASSEAPLFMFRLPSDAYICCAASLHETGIIVHPAPTLGLGPRCFPRGHLEVIGRVTAIARGLGR